MKTSFSLALCAGLACTLLLTSCQKENMNTPANAENSSDATAGGDKIDAIMGDLSIGSYSLSFDKALPDAGILRTAYGADNYLAFADPQDLKCGTSFRIKYKQIPIWRRPNIIWPTCPDMTIDINKLTEIQDLLVNADKTQFGALKQLKFLSGGGFLGNETFTGQFAKMQLDKIDDALTGMGLSKYLLLNDPKKLDAYSTKSFYGYADLNKYVFAPYKRTLGDILPPTLKGCYDPIVLNSIKAKLQKIDASLYKGLTVTYLPESKSIGILSMN